MIRLDAATVLLQWATGGMLFCWFTTRRRVIGVGYGWLLRGTYLCFAGGATAHCMRLRDNSHQAVKRNNDYIKYPDFTGSRQGKHFGIGYLAPHSRKAANGVQDQREKQK